MKNLFGWMLAALLALTVGVSCSDDDDLNEGAGIASPAWKAENQAVIEGETLDFEFTAEGRWTAVSSADWCEVKTPSGVAGESLLRLKVAIPLRERMGSGLYEELLLVESSDRKPLPRLQP